MNPSFKSARGFTLMESVIAIGVVAVLLTTFLAIFGPASQSIQRALSAQEADRLQTALERELSILREESDGNFDSAFDKAFDWLLNSHDAGSAVLLYNYRGNPNDIRRDGSLAPYTGKKGTSGKDYILQPAVRRTGGSSSDQLQADLAQVEGRVYLVVMTQLVFENGGLAAGDPGQIVDPHNPTDAYDQARDFPEAVIAYLADFYALKSNSFDYIERLDLKDSNGDGRPDVLGLPLFSRNLAVRR